MTYLTHDCDGCPFKIWYQNDTVQVYPIRFSGLPLTFQTDQFLVGISPLNEMTEASNNFGDEYDGNGILARIAKDPVTYYFIGHAVYIFRAIAPIVTFFSPIGKAGVPYPWAEDALGNVYLFTEEVILKASDKLDVMIKDEKFDPYRYYREADRTFSCEHPFTRETIFFEYHADAHKHFDRMVTWKEEFPEMAKGYEKLGREIVTRVIVIWGEQNGYLTLPILQRFDQGSWR